MRDLAGLEAFLALALRAAYLVAKAAIVVFAGAVRSAVQTVHPEVAAKY